MVFRLLYHPNVAKIDLPTINKNIQKRIRKAIEQRLLLDPERFGMPLRKGLKGYRKMRVGDYRVIYEIKASEIRIYCIGHRKEVYDLKFSEWGR